MVRQRLGHDGRREQILEGALTVFSSKGFAMATNRDIAEAAGIRSPGLIYHYFESKADLFQAVVERLAPPLQMAQRREENFALPPREFLLNLANGYLTLYSNPKAQALLRVVIGETSRQQEFAHVLAEMGPLRMLSYVGAYLQTQMETGTLRSMSPTVAARCFIGPLIAVVLPEALFGIGLEPNLSVEEVAQTTVDVFLRGMAREKA